MLIYGHLFISTPSMFTNVEKFNNGLRAYAMQIKCFDVGLATTSISHPFSVCSSPDNKQVSMKLCFNEIFPAEATLV